MRIVVWGINYSPELTGIGPCNTALCEHLAAKGHSVEMLTSFAYYPAWAKSAEDSNRLFRTDLVNGVKVRRCWHFVPSKVTPLKRIAHELSFVVCSAIRFLFLKRPDVFVVVSPPLLLGFAAWILGILKRAPFIFHVQDLQPDAAVGLGMLKPGLITQALYRLERLAYQKAARVSGISQGMLAVFAQKMVPPAKIVYFPNGVALESPGRDADGTFRGKLGFADSDFLAVYSGNLGAKQGLSNLATAASLVRDPRVKLVICGDGAHRDGLIAQAKGKQIFFLPLQAEPEYRQMLNEADICLITQAAGTGRFFFPSKLLTTLARSRPVLSVADEESELVSAIKEAGCGVNVAADRPRELAEALDRLAAHPEELAEMGQRGLEYVRRFETGKVLEQFEAVLASTARG